MCVCGDVGTGSPLLHSDSFMCFNDLGAQTELYSTEEYNTVYQALATQII